MVKSSKSTLPILWALVVLLLGAGVGVALFRETGDGMAEVRSELESLGRRLARVEGILVEGRGGNPGPSSTPSPSGSPLGEADSGSRSAGSPATASPATGAPARTRIPLGTPDLAELRDALKGLSTRVANLETGARKTRDQAKSLAAPDSIPAALAVLLASRGVITKVGDVEAIQANLPTLAALVADPTAGEWDRIEAFRGMMMFGFQQPERCVDAMPGIASLVLESADPKVRKSAAAMLQNYKNPAIAATLMAAYRRESEVAVRTQIISAMLQLRDDAGIAGVLADAAKNEADPDLRARIRKLVSLKKR